MARRGDRRDVQTGFRWEDLRKRDHVEYLGVRRRIILKWIFRKFDLGGWDMDVIGVARFRDR